MLELRLGPPRHSFRRLAFGFALILAGAACAAPAPSAPVGPTAAPAAASTAAPPASKPISSAPTATAAGGNPRPGGTLTIASWAEPITLDPTSIASDVPASQISQNIYDTLVRYDADAKTFKPELAESWDNPDPLTWVFHLRRGVQFHKGYGEMTAEDVAFTINTVIDNKKSPAVYYPVVKHVDVLDPYTVQFNLTQPYAPLLAITASGQGGIVQSKKAFQEKGETGIARDPVGTGPFFLQSWTAGDRLVLKKNDKYWQPGLPYLDGIVWRVVPDGVVRENLVNLGEADFNDQPNLQTLADVSKKNPKVVAQSTAGWNFDWIRIDMSKPPFDKKEVRQAMSWAIDRRSLADGAYFGAATPTDNMLPMGSPGSTSPLLAFSERGDPARAKDLLAKAGYADGFSADLVVKGKDSILREAQIIADQLEKVNIKLTITPLDNATFVARTYKKNDFQLGISSTALIGPDPDASTMTFYHSKTGVAYYAHDDSGIDALLEQGQMMSLGPERDAHYLSLGQRLVDDSFYIYLLNAPIARVMSTTVKGFTVHPLDQKMTFLTTWLDRN